MSGLNPLNLLQDALKEVEYVIVGSWALYLQGLLNRFPGDIDIVTKENFYHNEETFGLTRNRHGNSDKFQVGDRTVKAFMLSTGWNDDQVIDVFHSDDYFPEYVLALVNNKWLKIEKVSSIIEVKKQYIASNLDGPYSIAQKNKHQGDLDYIKSLLDD